MKSKILITALIILSVTMYTLAVINFTQWHVIDGITDTIIAVTDTILAFVIFRQQLDHKFLRLTAKTLADLLTSLEKGVKATLTVCPKDEDEDEEDKGDEIPEDQLTADEKRIKRMAEEYDELCGRLERLTAFLASDKFKSLPDNSRALLIKQHQAMTDYESTLKERIKIDCANTGK